MRCRSSVGPPGLQLLLFAIQGLRARFARPCPWLPYFAPSALGPSQTPSAPSALRPATLFRAFGARPITNTICAFGAPPGYLISRLKTRRAHYVT
jgi:hypothetical protein